MGQFQEIDFLTWYEIVADTLKKEGYTKVPAKDIAKKHYQDDMSPEESALQFAEAWGDPSVNIE